VIASRPSALLIAAIAGFVVLTPLRAQAQWWSRAPADFEECADKAEKATAKEEKASKLSECNAKFAGRRKPGGGYTYYDFMQNRSFDIAGPNPTPEEQKKIDEQYTVFLDRERRNSIAAALSAKQQQQLLQQASLRDEKVPLPVGAPNKPQPAAFGKHQGSEEAVRLPAGQGEEELIDVIPGSPASLAPSATSAARLRGE